MAGTLTGDILDKVREINQKNYDQQAIYFLNAFFPSLDAAAKENIFQLSLEFAKEDHVKGKNGNELNPIQAFHLLQQRSQTLTALELKAQLRKVDIDANGEMALAEYLLFTYNKDPITFATAPQGSATPEEQARLDAAEKQLAELSDLFDQLAAAKQAAVEAENNVRALKKEAEAIAAEIKKEEDAKAAEIARLEALSVDQTVGIVKRNMAVQQLAAAKNEDPLPLRKAKLTQDAVVRKLEKAVKAASDATQAATDKANECADQLQKAQEMFEQLKATCAGIAHGQIWMMERQLTEKKKYLPQSRQ